MASAKLWTYSCSSALSCWRLTQAGCLARSKEGGRGCRPLGARNGHGETRAEASPLATVVLPHPMAAS